MVKVGLGSKMNEYDYTNSFRTVKGHGTPYWAPECFNERVFMKSDVWALGISIIEMAEGKNPYHDDTPVQIKSRVLYSDPPSLSSGRSDECANFVKRCLVKDVDERASVDELLNVRVGSKSYD